MASLQTQAFFKRVCSQPANQKCIDCSTPNPQWASVKFGCYFCLECSGTHRGLGVHIDFVRSVDMDSWKDAELRRMELGGNAALEQYFVANGLQGMSIEEKYTTDSALLYREQLACRSENKPFDRSAALTSIRTMQQQIEERKARMRAISGAGVGSDGQQHTMSQAPAFSEMSWSQISQSTSELLGKARAASTTAASVAADTTRSWVARLNDDQNQMNDQQNTQTPYTDRPSVVSQETVERAKQMTSRGVGFISSTLGTCFSAANQTWQNRLQTGTQADEPDESDAPQNRSDLGDLFGTSKAPQSINGLGTNGLGTNSGYSDSGLGNGTSYSNGPGDPSDLSDLFGSGGSSGFANNRQTSSGFSGQATTKQDQSDLSDLFPSRNNDPNVPVATFQPPVSASTPIRHNPVPATNTNAQAQKSQQSVDTSWADGWEPEQTENQGNIASSAPVQESTPTDPSDPNDWAWEDDWGNK